MKNILKIACCISGQPRSYKIGHEYIRKNLLDVYDVDVFYHTWFNDTVDFDEIEHLYEPKNLVVEKPLPNVYAEKYPRIPGPKFPAYFTVSAFYSIYTANLLKQQYEKENNFEYDWVVRIRFDYALNGDPDFLTKDNTKLYIPNCRIVPERNFGNDQFAMSSSKNIDKYSSTHTHLDEFYNKGTTMIGEDMLKENLIYHNLVGENLVYMDMNNPFPPGPHNGTWHSLIREDYENWTAS